MKKRILSALILVLAVLLVTHIATGAIREGTNMALNKTVIGTYSNAASATDGIVNVKMAPPARSFRVSDADQFLTIDIGKLVYVDRVKVYFDAAAYPRSFALKTSTDGKYWEEEVADLDASAGVKDTRDGTIYLNISCKRAVIGARYVQLQIPAGSVVSKGDQVRISEIEIFPAMNQKLSIVDKDAYAVTDNTAVIYYKTSIGTTTGKVMYGPDPSALKASTPNQENGVANSATIYGLDPGKNYFYKVEATDLYGNTVSSDIGRFSTTTINVANRKPVEGTFTELPPGDPFVNTVKPVLGRVTDGSTSYFTAMATSRSVLDSDQYITIDLQRSYKINNIQAYWRKLAYPEKYSVLVSSDKKNWKTIASNLNAGDGAFSRSDTGDPMQILSVPVKNEEARYIKVLVPQGSPFFHKHADWNFVQLMEVKVFAD